jgi:wyosine [tRNA(Phe)-imidazoG37] synthetase (radical SAM superfamily)
MNNYFCVLPFLSYENGYKSANNIYCCLLPGGTDIVNVQDSMKNQQRAPACAKCWKIEDQGKPSRRMLENSFLDHKLDKNIEDIENDCISAPRSPLLYQITTSNLCNQACVSCNSVASTRWAEIERKMNIVPNKSFNVDLQHIAIDYKHARRISLLGGEPLFDPTTFEILSQLQQAGNTDCFISFVTNGSIELNPAQIQLLESFTDLNFCISIDGIGPVFEYLRWPGKWNQLLDNIEQYKKITSSISVSYTISSLNALYYNQTTEWFDKNNLQYNYNIVTYPDWLSLNSMPVPIKEHLRNCSFINHYCEITGHEISTTEFLKQIQLQDTAKKISIQDYMPELVDLLTR